jgi:predicted HTH transcriptional regulator
MPPFALTPVRIFISSVQKEFSRERAALRDYLQGDALMRRFFEVFLFEDVPAADRRTDDLYLDEVRRCDIYVGLFGNDYGSENAGGLSPTEREFDLATAEGKYRLIYVRGTDDDAARHPKMRALIGRAEAGLIRKRFNTPSELVAGLYAALVEYLEEKQLIRSGPFDAAPCMKATPGDLDPDRMAWFIRTARATRRFPLAGDASPHELLAHLNLLDDGKVTNAAVLLFGKRPQRYLISSEIKCAHFHGTEVAKPIPSYQVYKGTVFDLVDAAVDFVLSKIALSVGTREAGPQAPVRYEIPKEAVAEAIVNAVAHRDYTSNGSVQVMLFSDRLEVWNPGTLPPSLTLEKLREAHGSVPGNPLLAEPMYLTGYIERMGTGTRDMIRRCTEAGLPEPEFAVSDGFQTIIRRVPAPGRASQPESRPESQPESQPESLETRALLLLESGPKSKAELSRGLGQKEISGQLNKVVRQLLAEEMIEYTIPEKPSSRHQKYRLTGQGRAALAKGSRGDTP